MINELHVPVFTAFITGFIEPFSVGGTVHFQRGNFHYFWLKRKSHISCKAVSDNYFYYLIKY